MFIEIPESHVARLNLLVDRDGVPPEEFIALVEAEHEAKWNPLTQRFEAWQE